MKFSVSLGISLLVIATAWVAAGLTYRAQDRIALAGGAALEAGATTLNTYRSAQALKSLTSGYELAMNEYYSTVLEAPTYEKKAAEHQAAIQRELLNLGKTPIGDAGTLADLKLAFKDMETYRLTLERALSAADKDWDGAREALYKVNVVAVRAIQNADTLAQVAAERAEALSQTRQKHQTQAEALVRGALLLALAAGGLALIGLILARRSA